MTFQYIGRSTRPPIRNYSSNTFRQIPFKRFDYNNVVEFGTQPYPVGYADTIGRRPTMEDAMTIVGNFAGDNTSFYGLFDGHGGSTVSHIAAHQLYQDIANHFDDVAALPTTIANSIKNINSTLIDDFQDEGSTMAIAIIAQDYIYTANLGDTRIVLSDPTGDVIRLTYDHKASDIDEQIKIEDNGGSIIRGRVNGNLMITRALGDGSLSNYLIHEPYMTKTPREDDQLLILACDGVWDVMSDDEAAMIARIHENNTIRAAQAIVSKAFERGSTDNISCIVVNLTPKFTASL